MEEDKMKSAMFRVMLSLLLCLVMIILRFVLKEAKITEEIYNYLTTDIVFLR